MFGSKKILYEVKYHLIQVALLHYHNMSLVFNGIAGGLLAVYLLLCTKAWPLILAYLIFLYRDRNICHRGGRKSRWILSWPLWSYYKEYFPLSLKKTADLPSDRNYMFCSFPHGLTSAAAAGNFLGNKKFGEIFPALDVYFAVLELQFIFPFAREYWLRMGAVAASKKSIKYLMSSPEKGKVLILMVGGAEEALYSHPGTNKIILKKRKGFIKIALITGETDLFHQVSNPPGSTLFMCQNFLRQYIGIAPCLPKNLLPRKCPVVTVVGSPIEVPKIENPSTEDIQKYHEIFIKELVTLFETHKHNYVENPEEAQLVLI